MTSQGQRFRRRALRRGYKVDEVDSFLDRVEATLAGDPLGAPVSAQEVHDVVFRVRFGGYDEWQVDLHLDRVERQLGELEERGGFSRQPEHGGQPERVGPQDRMPPPAGMPPLDRIGPPAGMPPPDRMGPPAGMPPPDRMGPPMRDDHGMPLPPRPVSPMPTGGPPQDPYGRYEDQGYGPGYEQQQRPFERAGSYDAFEPGRHGKMDMTAEIRLPDREALMGPAMSGPPPMAPPPPVGGPGPTRDFAPPAPTGGPSAVPAGDLQRIDMLRRTFQPRRFGSGYDPGQVDRLFEGILTAMAGRGPMPINEAELDTAQFGLVPGGYFEAEVDAALREVRDILRRH